MVLNRLIAVAMLVCGLGAVPAAAQRNTTTEALARLEEVLTPQIEDGRIGPTSLYPILLVSAQPAYEETRASYPAEALATLVRILDAKNIRACEACMNPRVIIEDGRLDMSTGSMSIEEAVRFDMRIRGRAAPARAAVWIDETRTGVAVRIISLENGQVVFAANLDGELRERSRTAQNFTFADDIARRLRGESLTHVIIDAALVPGQHVGFDVVEQFGDNNNNLAGISVTALDPLVGFGASYYRIIPQAFNLTVGVKLLASVPTALGSALVGEVSEVVDPLFVGALVVRFPIPYTSFAALGTVSTKGTIGFGVTLMSMSFLPFLP